MTRASRGRQTTVRFATRALQALLAALLGYSVLTGEYTVAFNILFAFGFTLLPAALKWRYDHVTDARLALWITVAALFHAGGFLGGYDVQTGPLQWYDKVAHAISASFVAGVAYALLQAIDRDSTRNRLPGEFRFVFTLFLILAIGVAWEIVEFSAGALGASLTDKEVLVQYGIDDIVFDLVFNTLAAALVALWGTAYFRGVARFFTSRFPGSGRS